MSYSTVEDALLTIIQAHANYSSANSSQGDYHILGNGASRYVVLTPGPIRAHNSTATLGSGPSRRMRTVWVIQVNLIIPWRGEISTIASQIRTDRQTLIDQIDAYPTLDGTSGVIISSFESAGNPENWLGAEERNFWKQELTVAVEERTNVTVQE